MSDLAPGAVPADPTKVMGRRVVAALVDGLLVFVPAAAIASSQFEYIELGSQEMSGSEFCDQYLEEQGGICFHLDDTVYFDEGTVIPSLALVGIALLFFVVLQGLTGWTVGKLITGIRNVREDGRPPGLGRAFVRWALWIVDGLPFAGLVGFITGLTTTGHRRVGDMVAKTFVVRSDAAGAPIVVPGLTAPPGSGAWTTAVPAPTAREGPQWDEARGTYIQWDPEQAAWMQWDDAGKAWNPIPVPAGQASDGSPIPPPPPAPPGPSSPPPPPPPPA